MSPLHTTPKEFENRGFALKRMKCFSPTLRRRNLTEIGDFALKAYQMFSVHITPEEFLQKIQSPVILNLCLRKTGSGKSRDFVTSLFSESFVLKMFSVHTKTT